MTVYFVKLSETWDTIILKNGKEHEWKMLSFWQFHQCWTSEPLYHMCKDCSSAQLLLKKQFLHPTLNDAWSSFVYNSLFMLLVFNGVFLDSILSRFRYMRDNISCECRRKMWICKPLRKQKDPMWSWFYCTKSTTDKEHHLNNHCTLWVLFTKLYKIVQKC